MIVADSSLIAYLLIPGDKSALADEVLLKDADGEVFSFLYEISLLHHPKEGTATTVELKDGEIDSLRAEVADMRSFDMGRRYALVFCGFNGFAHCETPPDQLAFLRAAYRHLAPGGVLALHMSYPGPAYWSEPEGKAVLEHEAPSPGGGKVQLWDNRRKDPVAQRQESDVEIWELDAADRPKAVHRFSTVQRWVYPFELELLFAAAGFARWDILGGFDGRPLRAPDDQMIARAFRD